jgi:hypothetical protein
MKPGSKRIVVDASIAHAAGTTEHHTSRACREFLESFLKVCHRAVMTAEVRAEWKTHRSRFSRTWLASMFARKKVEVCGPEVNLARAARLNQAGLTASEEGAIRKDAPLLEAALATDSAIAFLDEAVRSLLKKASRRWKRIRPVVWVNPALHSDQAVSWLSAGAPSERERMLGFEVGR